jgi:hypothetical protein
MKFAQGGVRRLARHFGANFEQVRSLLATLLAAVPHVQTSTWASDESGSGNGARLVGNSGNKKLAVYVSYQFEGNSYSLKCIFTKGRAFGAYERAFIDSLAKEIAESADLLAGGRQVRIRPVDVVDSSVAKFLLVLASLGQVDLLQVVAYLKGLAQQSYESKAISFGLIVLPGNKQKEHSASFPADIDGQKRFQALTDGYRTALVVDRSGQIVKISNLSEYKPVGEHFRPIWLGALADTADRHDGLGFALTRNGAILISWNSNLLLSFRAGRWMLWNHSENVGLIHEALKRRGPKIRSLGRVASRLYRCALDLSFRRSGGLLVALNTPNSLGRLVPATERLEGRRRSAGDRALGEWLNGTTVFGLDRDVLDDLAALDGAVVCDRSGAILAYGSILLSPHRRGLAKIEGSRSRAAHSASYFGVAIKISSDGGIVVVKRGKPLLQL